MFYHLTSYYLCNGHREKAKLCRKPYLGQKKTTKNADTILVVQALERICEFDESGYIYVLRKTS